MTHRRTIFLLFFLSKLLFVTAQGGSTIKATLDKNKILLGESLTLTVEAHHSPESVISFVSIDSIPHFEMLEKPQVDSVTQEGMTTIKGIYKLTSFDSGHWVIPSFVLNGGIKTDTLPVDVVFSDFDPSKDYHDIKDIIEVKPPKKKPWWWYAAGAAVLLAALLFYWLKRKKPVPAIAKPVQTANPYAEAMKQLDELKRGGVDAKQFHTKLVDIFRLYIFRKKGMLSLQKTTDDLVLQLKGLNLPKEQFDKLSQSLRLSDFVKFAKYNPTDDDNNICFNNISNSIKTIELSGS